MEVTDAWNLIYTAITSSVSDPEGRGTKWIFSAYPDVYAKDFPDFPVIIVDPANCREKQISMSGERNKRFVVSIDVFSRSLQQADSLIKEVISSIRDIQNVYDVAIDRVEYSVLDHFGKRVHARSAVVSFSVVD